MTVEVKLFGTLGRFSKPETPGLWCGEIPQGTTVEGLISILGIKINEVGFAVVNDKKTEFDYVILDNSNIVLSSNFGAG